MFQSRFPDFLKKEFPKDEESYNAKILVRAGFVNKLMAGVYSYLPLGFRVLKNIENIIKKHMDKMGIEILMPILHPKENWEITGRWNNFDALFKVISNNKKKEYGLGPTHEEVVVPLAQEAILSYKDLPLALYQIQTKLRDEPRAKSGLLRGREFLMKDLYSFHTDSNDLKRYYNLVKDEYKKIFKEFGLDALVVEASGGTFSKFSHEFQVPLNSGEDIVVVCESCGFAQNSEINSSKEGDPCPKCGNKLRKIVASEIGNIFELNTKYSDPFVLKYKDKDGNERPIYMGCYGIGISRLFGVIAEIFHDENGLMWPDNVAPFNVHILSFFSDYKGDDVLKKSREIYEKLTNLGYCVLFDDREDITNGRKLAEADLIGIPVRLVISKKTGDKIEFKKRDEKEIKIVDLDFVINYLKNKN